MSTEGRTPHPGGARTTDSRPGTGGAGEGTREAEYVPYDPSAGGIPRGVPGAFILLLCAVVPFVMFAIAYEVVARQFFGAVPLWVNDATGWLLMGVTFLGGAFVMSRDGHVRVDILVAHSGAGVQRVLTVVNTILVLFVSLVLACVAGYAMWDGYRRNVSVVGVIEIPRHVMLSPVFVGSVLLCIERMVRLRDLVRASRRRR